MLAVYSRRTIPACRTHPGFGGICPRFLLILVEFRYWHVDPPMPLEFIVESGVRKGSGLTCCVGLNHLALRRDLVGEGHLKLKFPPAWVYFWTFHLSHRPVCSVCAKPTLHHRGLQCASVSQRVSSPSLLVFVTGFPLLLLICSKCT